MSHEDYPAGPLQGWANAPVSVPREIATDTRISSGARGLYLYLLTRGEGAEMTPVALAEELPDSLPKINGWWTELKSVGLITPEGGR
ncbi:hypothetical protein [Streptomyces sp. RTd22]|uniref:hypothetical protein n=1 Tax=Streptomyces sp. RTd22 TaxID=1841249 RepID=UPI0007C56B85|nr:hypothetical protein [Streptomyces sp. RTd22]